MAGLKYVLLRLKKIWADAAYYGKELADWCQQRRSWELEIVKRELRAHGFTGTTTSVGSGADICLAIAKPPHGQGL